jgi:hypothetical protein
MNKKLFLARSDLKVSKTFSLLFVQLSITALGGIITSFVVKALLISFLIVALLEHSRNYKIKYVFLITTIIPLVLPFNTSIIKILKYFRLSEFVNCNY